MQKQRPRKQPHLLHFLKLLFCLQFSHSCLESIQNVPEPYYYCWVLAVGKTTQLLQTKACPTLQPGSRAGLCLGSQTQQPGVISGPECRPWESRQTGPSPSSTTNQQGEAELAGENVSHQTALVLLFSVYRMGPVGNWDYFRILENLHEKGDYLPCDATLIFINTK